MPSGNRNHYSAARANLKKGIKEAKTDYRRRIEDHLESNNSWQVSHLTNLRNNLEAAEGDLALPEELKIFLACFEVTAPEAQRHHTAHSSTFLTLEECGPTRGRQLVLMASQVVC